MNNKVVQLKQEKALKNVRPNIAEAIANGDHEACFEGLTAKQQQFCLEYLKDLNASKAVIRAGYKTSTNSNRMGSELLAKPGIAFALQGLMARRAEKQEIDAHYVINKIVNSLERSENSRNEQAVLRAAELLGKHLGVFIERQEISGPDGAAIELERKTEQDAAAFTRSIASLAKSRRTSGEDEPANDGSESET